MVRENEMYGPLVAHFRDRGFVVLREVTTYQGRIDVLALRLDADACDRRRAIGISAVTAPNLLRVWAALPRVLRSQAVPELATSLAVLPATLRASLRALSDHGVVLRDEADWIRVVKPTRIAKEIVCCEAKLADWQAVVRQAYGHRFYAHRSFVALHRVPRTLDQEILDRRRLGLMQVSGEGVRRHRPAPATRPPDTLASMYLQECAWSELARSRTAPPKGASSATA